MIDRNGNQIVKMMSSHGGLEETNKVQCCRIIALLLNGLSQTFIRQILIILLNRYEIHLDIGILICNFFPLFCMYCVTSNRRTNN